MKAFFLVRDEDELARARRYSARLSVSAGSGERKEGREVRAVGERCTDREVKKVGKSC